MQNEEAPLLQTNFANAGSLSPIAAVLALALLVRLIIAQMTADLGNLQADRPDFNQLYNAASRLNSHQHLYPRDNSVMYPPDIYVYPPLPAIVLRPLARLPYPRAVHVWCCINIACLLAGAAFCALAMNCSCRAPAGILLIGLTLLRFWPLRRNFVLGNINLEIFALLGAMYWANARSRLHLLALLIVACLLIKTWMAGLFLYLILRRAWRPLATGILATFAAMAACFAIVGRNEWPFFLAASRTYSIQPKLHSNSIFGTATIYFSKNPLTTPLLQSRALFLLFVISGSGLVVAGLTWLFVRRVRPSTFQQHVALGLVIQSVLLLCPLCQLEYFILCLPLLWIIILNASPQSRRRTIVLSILSAVAYVLWSPNTGGGFGKVAPGESAGWGSLRLAAAFLASMLLWITAWAALQESNSNQQPNDKTNS